MSIPPSPSIRPFLPCCGELGPLLSNSKINYFNDYWKHVGAPKFPNFPRMAPQPHFQQTYGCHQSQKISLSQIMSWEASAQLIYVYNPPNPAVYEKVKEYQAMSSTSPKLRATVIRAGYAVCL